MGDVLELAPWRCIGVDRMLRALKGRAAPKREKLSHGARVVALLVANYNVAFFSVAYLADLLGVAESTARGYCAELELAGVIIRHEQVNGVGGCDTNRYEIALTADDFPPPRSKTRGAPTARPPRKQGVGNQGSQREEEEGEIKAADEPPVENSEPPPAPADSELKQRLDAVFEKLEEVEEQPLESEPEKRDAQEVETKGSPRPRVRKRSSRPLALSERRSPLPLSPELIVALRDVPCGHQALELLWSKLMHKHPHKRIQHAAKRTVEYHAKHGVDDAVKFIQVVLKGLKHEEDEAARYQQYLDHDAPWKELGRYPAPPPKQSKMPDLKKCAPKPEVIKTGPRPINQGSVKHWQDWVATNVEGRTAEGGS